MNNRRLKTFLATLLASMLLYYNAAWAVLRCYHVDERGSLEEILSPDDLRVGLYPHLSRPSHAPSQIDCLDFEYQTEVLAGPASAPQFHWLTTDESPFTNDFILVKHFAERKNKPLGRMGSNRRLALSEMLDSPRYLYLSGLRI